MREFEIVHPMGYGAPVGAEVNDDDIMIKIGYDFSYITKQQAKQLGEWLIKSSEEK